MPFATVCFVCFVCFVKRRLCVWMWLLLLCVPLYLVCVVGLMHWVLHQCVDWHIINTEMIIHRSSCCQRNDFVWARLLRIVRCQLMVRQHINVCKYHVRQLRTIGVFEMGVSGILECTKIKLLLTCSAKTFRGRP